MDRLHMDRLHMDRLHMDRLRMDHLHMDRLHVAHLLGDHKDRPSTSPSMEHSLTGTLPGQIQSNHVSHLPGETMSGFQEMSPNMKRTRLVREEARLALLQNCSAKIVVVLPEAFLAPRVASLFIAGLANATWHVDVFAPMRQANANNWELKWADNNVMVMSAASLLRLLNGREAKPVAGCSKTNDPTLDLDDIDMMVLDDVHRAHGDRTAYSKVVQLYSTRTAQQRIKRPRVLGVTMFPHRMGDPVNAVHSWNGLVGKLTATVLCMEDEQAEVEKLNAPMHQEEALLVNRRDKDQHFERDMGEFVATVFSMFEHVQGMRADLASLGPIPSPLRVSKGQFCDKTSRWLKQAIEGIQFDRDISLTERSDLLACLHLLQTLHDALDISHEFGCQMALKHIWDTVDDMSKSQTLACLREQSQVPFIGQMLDCLCKMPCMCEQLPSDVNPSLVDCVWFPRFTALVSMLAGHAARD
ncbi:unnamed protein product, partial [Ostreobium quekettii]